jgi:hypothetical protein
MQQRKRGEERSKGREERRLQEDGTVLIVESFRILYYSSRMIG